MWKARKSNCAVKIEHLFQRGIPAQTDSSKPGQWQVHPRRGWAWQSTFAGFLPQTYNAILSNRQLITQTGVGRHSQRHLPSASQCCQHHQKGGQLEKLHQPWRGRRDMDKCTVFPQMRSWGRKATLDESVSFTYQHQTQKAGMSLEFEPSGGWRRIAMSLKPASAR